MARTGRFGRLPKSAPDLTATIVGLMREFANQVDSNYVDAWQNGGTVDGKPVTDSRLLAHMKARRDELSRDDPLWTEWNDKIQQYTFSIDESKMTVKYDNGQASEAQMADFYQRWADKTPDNTELDRTLQSKAGKWRASASQKRASGAASARNAAYASATKSLINQYDVDKGQVANQILTEAAKAMGILPAGDNTDFSDSQAGQGDVQRLLDLINDGSVSGFEAITDWATKQLKKNDPDFPGWSTSYFVNLFDKNDTGLQKLQALAAKDGPKSDATYWGKVRKQQAISKNRVANLNDMDDAMANRRQLEDDLANSKGDPTEERNAWDRYYALQQKIYNGIATRSKPGDPGFDAAFMGSLGNELQNIRDARAGKQVTNPPPTWVDSTVGTTAESGQDAVDVVGHINDTYNNAKLIDDGGWASIETDPDDGTKQIYVFHPASQALGPDQVMLPGGFQAADGRQVATYGSPTPVGLVAVDPSGRPTGATAIQTKVDPGTGKKVPVFQTDNQGQTVTDATGAGVPVETTSWGFDLFVFPDPVTGKTRQLYRSQDPQTGADIWRNDPPLKPGTKTSMRQDPKTGAWSIQVTVDPLATMTTSDRPLTSLDTGEIGRQKSDAEKAKADALARWQKLTGRKDNQPTEIPSIRGDTAGGTGTLFADIQKAYSDYKAADAVVQGATRATTTGVIPQITQTGFTQPTVFDPTAYIDDSLLTKDPKTGTYQNGTYQSWRSGLYASMIDDLDIHSPSFGKDLANINDSMSKTSAGLIDLAAEMYRTGKADEARKLTADAYAFQSDLPQLTGKINGVKYGQAQSQISNPFDINAPGLSPHDINRIVNMTPDQKATAMARQRAQDFESLSTNAAMGRAPNYVQGGAVSTTPSLATPNLTPGATNGMPGIKLPPIQNPLAGIFMPGIWPNGRPPETYGPPTTYKPPVAATPPTPPSAVGPPPTKGAAPLTQPPATPPPPVQTGIPKHDLLVPPPKITMPNRILEEERRQYGGKQ